jgi:hypothetical protein
MLDVMDVKMVFPAEDEEDEPEITPWVEDMLKWWSMDVSQFTVCIYSSCL